MKKRKFDVAFARRAEIMLLSHASFIAQVSPNAARKLLADCQRRVNVIAGNPLQFPFADELDIPNIPFETYRKCLFGNRYKIIFLFENNLVYIDTIIDSRQENKNLY